MTDIVERLRMQGMDSDMQDTAREAADEIERLRRADKLARQFSSVGLIGALENENTRLREMLDKIAKHPNTPELIRQYAAGMLETKP